MSIRVFISDYRELTSAFVTQKKLKPCYIKGIITLLLTYLLTVITAVITFETRKDCNSACGECLTNQLATHARVYSHSFQHGRSYQIDTAIEQNNLYSLSVPIV